MNLKMFLSRRKYQQFLVGLNLNVAECYNLLFWWMMDHGVDIGRWIDIDEKIVGFYYNCKVAPHVGDCQIHHLLCLQ